MLELEQQYRPLEKQKANMMIKKNENPQLEFDSYQYSQVLLFTVIAGWLNGLALMYWIYRSSSFVQDSNIKYWILGMIPVSGLIWGVCRWKFRSTYINGISFILAMIFYSWWVIKTPSFHGIGDLISNPRDLFAVGTWLGLLIALMALIDLLSRSITLPSILTFVLLSYTIFSRVPIFHTSIFVGSKIGVWIIGIIMLVLSASISSVIIESVLLLYRELPFPAFRSRENR